LSRDEKGKGKMVRGAYADLTSPSVEDPASRLSNFIPVPPFFVELMFPSNSPIIY
jgi:hypothetical protein